MPLLALNRPYKQSLARDQHSVRRYGDITVVLAARVYDAVLTARDQGGQLGGNKEQLLCRYFPRR